MNNWTTRYSEGNCWRWVDEIYQTTVDTPWRNLRARKGWRKLTKNSRRLDEDFFGETDSAMRNWWKTRGRELSTTTEEKLKNCLIRKKAPAFMHKSTLEKTPLRVTCLQRGNPSFLTSSSIHQEKGKHIFILAFSWVPLRSFFPWDDSFFNFHPLLRRLIFLCT